MRLYCTIDTNHIFLFRSIVSTSSLSDQELYQQQQQKIVELENQLQKMKQLDSSSLQASHVLQHTDNTTATNVNTSSCLDQTCDMCILVDPTKVQSDLMRSNSKT